MSIRVEGVVAGYYKEINVLNGVSMKAEKSNITSVIGPNGAGKSTLLKTIYGFLVPKQGRIYYNYDDITGSKPYMLLGKGISYIPQHRSIFPYLTVEENLELGGWIFRRNRKRIHEAIKKVYDKYPSLENKRRQAASFLSGGELKMLEIGKALIVDPEVLLVDEPTAGLAPKLFKGVHNELEKLARKEGKTVILVDQNIRQAVKLADYVYVLEMGKNSIEGSREEFEAGRLRDIIKDWFT